MPLVTDPHPAEDDIELYAMHRTNERIVERIEEHLLICASCRSALDEVEREIRTMRIILRDCKPATYVQ